MKMEAAVSSETLALMYQITRRHTVPQIFDRWSCNFVISLYIVKLEQSRTRTRTEIGMCLLYKAAALITPLALKQSRSVINQLRTWLSYILCHLYIAVSWSRRPGEVLSDVWGLFWRSSTSLRYRLQEIQHPKSVWMMKDVGAEGDKSHCYPPPPAIFLTYVRDPGYLSRFG